MATALKGTAAAAGIPAMQSIRENTIAGKYVLAAALIINDTIDLCQLPANSFLTSVYISVPDLDSSTGVLLDLQLKTATTKIITQATIGQAAGVITWPAVVVAATNGTIAGLGLITAADTLQLLVQAAPSGTPATTGTFVYVVKFCTDVQYL